jgi:hypothetical protein
LSQQAPVADDPTITSGPIKLSQGSDFQKALAGAAAKPDLRNEIRAVAKPFIDSDKFVKTTTITDFQAKVNAFSAKVDKVEKVKTLTAKDVKVIVLDTFGKEDTEVVESDDFKNLMQGLRDSVLAIKYVQVG